MISNHEALVPARPHSVAVWRGRLTRLFPAIGLAALLVVDVALLVNAAQVLRAGLTAVGYPYELDFVEGPVLASTHALSTGGSLYPAADESPGRISNYTPVYYAATAALGSAFGNDLATGRALSLASAVLAAIVLSVLTWQAVEPGADRLVRGLAASTAGLAFLQISYTASWAALMRVDVLAVLLALTGVLAFSAGAARGRQVYWCLVPFLLAVYTKQTTVAAAAACVVTAARADLRRGVALGGALAAAIVLTATVLQASTHGGFLFHVITANVHPYNWDQTASFLQDIAIRYPVLVALAVAATPALLATITRRDRASSSARAEPRCWTRAVLGAYLPLAALTSLTVGKLGAEVNYLIELMAVVCVCAAVTLGRALRPSRSDDERARSRGAPIAALAVPLLLLWQVGWLAPPSAIELIETPAAAQQAQIADLLDQLQRMDGPVLSEDLTLLTLAGKPVLFQPFDIAQLVYAQTRGDAPIVNALERGEIQRVILHFDVQHPPPLALDRFTPAMIAAIRRAYVPRRTFPGYWLYAPRQVIGTGGA